MFSSNRLSSNRTMMHYQGNTEYVDKCREQGFVPLVWEENVVDKVTGVATDRSSLTGDRFRIDVILSPSFTKILERRERVGYADSTFTRVEIRFDYLTDIGPVSYSHVYEGNPYERAKEYAQWQATAIFKLLSNVKGTESAFVSGSD